MKKRIFISVSWLVFSVSIARADTCLDLKALMKIDAQYETALRTGDIKFLEDLLAPEFHWVHNLASLTETKTQLLTRMQQPEAELKARRAHDTRLLRLDKTAVLQGLSSVDKWNADGKTFRTSRYQFMRTYVEHAGQCKLLAVQTMKVWSSEGQN
jgi:hypothetical protein